MDRKRQVKVKKSGRPERNYFTLTDNRNASRYNYMQACPSIFVTPGRREFTLRATCESDIWPRGRITSVLIYS